MFFRQHAVTVKTNLFNLLIFLKQTSWGNYAYTELSETQNYAYWYARFFPGTHDFRQAGVQRTHVFLVGTRIKIQ